MNEGRIEVRIQRFADRKALQLQWTDEQGVRRTRSAKTSDPAKAEKARADLEYELNHGLDRPRARMSWEAFRELAEREYLPGRRPRTRGNYRETFDVIEELMRPTGLAAFSARTISGFVAALRQRPHRAGVGHKPQTIALRLTQLRALLRWAQTQGLIAAVPVFPAVPIPSKRPQPVPPELFDRLLERIDRTGDTQLRTFALCGWLAGMRRNEAYYLEWEETDAACWVDFGADRIRFPAEVVKAKADQWVPLDGQLREALLAMPRRDGNPRVFSFGLPARSVVRRMSKLARKVGWTMSMKTLRRGFGCRHAARVPAQVLQRLMRHSDISVTMDYYANIDDAVEAAIHGCNTSCNSQASRPQKTAETRGNAPR